MFRRMKTRIHPLRRWLFENQESTSRFAERSGLSRPSLSLLLNGHSQPTLPTIMRIRKATDGGVTAADFEAFQLEASGELT
jgi:transcriptional regulator with XRE-family HTH domain